jgi:ribosome-interacting GTPase 1
VRRKERGGISITNTVPLTTIDHDEIKAVLSEYRINNADVAIRQAGATADDLVDVIEGNRSVGSCSLRLYPQSDSFIVAEFTFLPST